MVYVRYILAFFWTICGKARDHSQDSWSTATMMMMMMMMMSRIINNNIFCFCGLKYHITTHKHAERCSKINFSHWFVIHGNKMAPHCMLIMAF